MRSTRRHSDHRAACLFVFASLGGVGIALVACTTSDDVVGQSEAPQADAAVVSTPLQEAGVDATKPRFEGTPLPVTCASEPCVVSLSRTLGPTPDARADGFCALLSDKTVACWGANASGQLGRGASSEDSSTPTRIAGLTDVVELEHTCAVVSNGDVYCWGTGPFLQDPANIATITTTTTPVKLSLPPAAHVGIGYDVGCAALTDGRVLCWGSNRNGQLAPPWEDAAPASAPLALDIPKGAPIARVLVGTATLLLREDGTAVSWGANPPLGRASSLSPDPSPAPIAASGIMRVDLAHDNACMAAGGAGYCWGVPLYPATSAPLERALPELVYTPEPIVDIATTRTTVENGQTRAYRWCAIGEAGKVLCRGANDDGQVGDGSFDDALQPKQVAGLSTPASRIEVTTSTSCALLTNGTVRCWGANSFGQLGNGQNRGRSPVPVEVLLP
ncbi:BNR repeat domain protein [Labilithrix luteola]|uniref:BNR repeat domain protein n=1 Tax=Labilithrix luteola TaxID=1391654 RepID=A0A0K1PT53_9BACT|nr:hypothetical protein [Labilithrix luteola]AKU96566.1 BNR repeat domain protein [Labilithrix luteola]